MKAMKDVIKLVGFVAASIAVILAMIVIMLIAEAEGIML